MKELKVYTSFANQMNLLSDAERGRLFTAMLTYAESGAESKLFGNERFLWDTAKQDIDRQAEAYKAMCERNRENGGKRVAPTGTQSQRLAPTGTQSLEEKERKEKKRNPPTEEKTALSRALDEFREFRKQMGKKLTPLAETKLLNELQRLAGDNEALKVAIIDQSIRNGWTGVFPIKGKAHAYEEHPAGNMEHFFVDLDKEAK